MKNKVTLVIVKLAILIHFIGKGIIKMEKKLKI
jgi:hypothetical protein